MHVDPLLTHAWVHCCAGLKRWLLLPPRTPPALLAEVGVGYALDAAHGSGGNERAPQLPSAVWFHRHHARVSGGAAAGWPPEYAPLELLQRPGECVFVPRGWHHLVLNLAWTSAVTHNYASAAGAFETSRPPSRASRGG